MLCGVSLDSFVFLHETRTSQNSGEEEQVRSERRGAITLRHSRGVTLLAFWELSSWAEEEEEAARRQWYEPVWGSGGK